MVRLLTSNCRSRVKDLLNKQKPPRLAEAAFVVSNQRESYLNCADLSLLNRASFANIIKIVSAESLPFESSESQ